MSDVSYRPSLGQWISLFLIVFAFAFPMFLTAQTPATTEKCKGAQAWYDSLDGAEIANYVEVSLDPKGTQLDHIEASTEIYNISASLADKKLPDCLQPAQKAYTDGLSKLSGAMAKALPPYVADQQRAYTYELAYSQRKIGEFRGYLAALGVKLDEPADPLTDQTSILIYK